MKEIVKKIMETLFSEKLEIEYRMLNAVLVIGILVLEFCMVLDRIINSDKGAFFLLLGIISVFILATVIVNVFKKPELASILLSILTTWFIMPFLC